MSRFHRYLSPAPLRIALVLCALTAWSCAQDRYAERTDEIKSHVKKFYENLEADRVGSAIAENQRLQAIGDQAGADVRRHGAAGANRVDRDWMLVRTANEAAAENWLALGRYFVIKKRYEEARGAYQRVLDEFPESIYHSYADQARQGLRDIDRILSPAAAR